MDISIGELKALNPQYRTGLVPGNTKPQSLTLPIAHIGDFIDLADTIRNHKSEVYLNRANLTVNPTRSTNIPPDIKGKTRLYYTVKDGDNLGFIAEWYRVGLSDLRYWNDIYSNTIRVGQKLAVYVDPAKSDYFARVDGMTFAQKQAMIGSSVPVNLTNSSAASAAAASGPDSEYIIYTVQYGDTIWDIVKKYDNVTTSEVLSLNNITDPGKLYVGQKLKIRKKS
jgi:membrane-bound lytic murein transglycosylase D